MKARKTLAQGVLVAAATLAGAGVAPAQSAMDNLSINGYLTQGFANSTDAPIHGIGADDLSGAYRSVALLFRYAITESDAFVVQLGHRNLGGSALNEYQDDVALEWGFYQKRFGGTSVRLGRVPLAKGIYNETRDVGTLLPFYRAPYNYYTEGMETIDGATVSRRFPLPGGFGLDASAYVGGWDYVQVNNDLNTGEKYVKATRGDAVAGGQMILSLPIDGVRIGGYAQRFSVDDVSLAGKPEGNDGLHVAGLFDATFSRVFVRGEAQSFRPGAWDYNSVYAQAGVQVLPQLWVNGQYDAADLKLNQTATFPVPGGMEGEYARDVAIGVKYDLSPNASLKLEGHRARGHQMDGVSALVVPTATGMMWGKGLETDYLIASVSVAF